MELSADQKKALDEQKSQCPFCKIIKGEIPSQKVYEDDKVLAILDINPATDGHILLMPKEHYPIMPLIPPEEFENLVLKLKDVSGAAVKAMVAGGSTIFIANGAAAGQQSQHFMIHIIPREKGDSLSVLELPVNKQEKEKLDEIEPILSNNLKQMLRNRYAKYPMEGVKAPEAQPKKVTKDQLMSFIESNPMLKDAIKTNPQEVIRQLPTNPQLEGLFKEFDVFEISKELGGVGEEDSEEEKEDFVSEEVIEETPKESVKKKAAKKSKKKTVKKTKKKSKKIKKEEVDEEDEDSSEGVNLDDISRLL